MSDYRFWIFFAGAWGAVFGYMTGTYLARRAEWKQKQEEQKLREAAIPGREISLVPPMSSYRDSYEQGRLISKVQFLEIDLQELNARIKKLESERESGAA